MKHERGKARWSTIGHKNLCHPHPLTILEPRAFFQPTETLGEVRVLVDEHLGRDDRPERVERLEEVRVRELLRQVVDEEVGPVRALVLLQAGRDPGTRA